MPDISHANSARPLSPLRFQGLDIVLNQNMRKNISSPSEWDDDYRTQASTSSTKEQEPPVEVMVTPFDRFSITTNDYKNSTISLETKMVNLELPPTYKERRKITKPFLDIYDKLVSAFTNYFAVYNKATLTYLEQGKKSSRIFDRLEYPSEAAKQKALPGLIKSINDKHIKDLKKSKTEAYTPIKEHLLTITDRLLSAHPDVVTSEERFAVLDAINTMKDVEYQPPTHTFKLIPTESVTPQLLISTGAQTPTG